MATTKPERFKIPEIVRETISFELESPDGTVEVYDFTTGKRAAMAFIGGGDSVGTLRGMVQWLEDGLPQEQADRLAERLKDADDSFDIDTLGNVVRHLIESSTKSSDKK